MADYGDADKGCYVDRGMSGYGVAVQLHRDEVMNEAYVRALAEEVMLDIAHKCEARGAKYIGHIKCHVRTQYGTVKADTLGHAEGAYSAGEVTAPVNELYMAVNSILFGLPEEQVKQATLDGIHEVADSHGLTVEKEKEHSYFDEFDYLQDEEEYLKTLKEQVEKDEETED